jgi:hypothetical protein
MHFTTLARYIEFAAARAGIARRAGQAKAGVLNMKYHYRLSAIFICSAAFGGSPPDAAPSAVGQADGGSLDYHTRTLRDLTRFDLSDVSAGEGDGWVVLRVVPYQCPIVERGGLAVAENGRVFEAAPHDPNGRALSGGKIDVISVLSGKPGCIERFEEIIAGPVGNAPDHGLSERLYSPFEDSHGGTLISRINNTLPGRFRFVPAILIPPDWAAAVPEAVQFRRQYKAYFDPANLAAARRDLERELRNKNPLVSVASARILGAVGGSDERLLAAYSEATDPTLKGLLIRALVCGGPPKDAAARIAAITKIVDGAKRFEDIRPVADGTLAALIDLRRSDNWNVVTPLLTALDAKAAASKNLSEYDTQILAMIKASSPAVREQRRRESLDENAKRGAGSAKPDEPGSGK